MQFVIITPAHNEQDFIKYTIESVLSQTIRPDRWVIVDDGSSDRTSQIVNSYAQQYEFIKLVKIEREEIRNFGKKAIAFGRGVVEVEELDYQFIGNLDADIILRTNYFEGILQEFYSDPKLGIGGGIVYTKIGRDFISSDKTLNSVGGAVQFFRRLCFDAIGGYIPLKYGGIDAAAEIKARMLGWKVRKFPEHKVFEQRRTGSANMNIYRSRIHMGYRFHSLGYGFLFHAIRCFYRFKDPPVLLGSFCEIYGFIECLIKRHPILLSNDSVVYLRNEQKHRLKNLNKLKGRRL